MSLLGERADVRDGVVGAAHVVASGRILEVTISICVQIERVTMDEGGNVRFVQDPRAENAIEQVKRARAIQSELCRVRNETPRGVVTELERAHRGEDDTLSSEYPERHVREYLPHGGDDGAELGHSDVVHLNPLLEHALCPEPRLGKVVELS